MNRKLICAAAICLAPLSLGALAQTRPVTKSICQTVGVTSQEPIGDRDAHYVSVSAYSCHSEGGLLEGTMTGTAIREGTRATPSC